MAQESAQHAGLVLGLRDLVEAAGFAVTALDQAGWRQPPSLRGHRPDLIARHLGVRNWIIGEAKLGPDLFVQRSLEQFWAFSHVLVAATPPTYARFILTVPALWTSAAWRALGKASARLGNTAVIGEATGQWSITWHPPPAAESWPGFDPGTRRPSSL
jgi:hypothetical protein